VAGRGGKCHEIGFLEILRMDWCKQEYVVFKNPPIYISILTRKLKYVLGRIFSGWGWGYSWLVAVSEAFLETD
jgi:hypothetical protein